MNVQGKIATKKIDEFFESLSNFSGIDATTAATIQKLWEEGKLGKDELITALEEARKGMESKDA